MPTGARYRAVRTLPVRMSVIEPRTLDRDYTGIRGDLRVVIQSLMDGSGKWPLFIWGPPGTGKTCAALATMDRVDPNDYVERIHAEGYRWVASHPCKYHTVRGLCGEIQNGFGGRSGTEALWRKIKNARVACLDEIGARRVMTDFVSDTTLEFLDSRDGQPAIYCSNLSPGKIAEVYDDRVSSRLCAGTVFQLDGDDRRLGDE